MGWTKSYFFCGIGGSGMLPLATILKAQGHEVSGSDRALDQGRSEAKFDWLAARGMKLFPQDGSGISGGDQILVASAAVEEHVPDVAAAARLGCARTSRAALLAGLFNAAPQSVAVGGTSGKSTVTGMLGWIAHRAGRDPTIMNGAVMRNFVGADTPFASSIVGGGGLFVSEVDESDGSIALFDPAVAVLNNVSIDHKPIDELRGLFGDFLKRARRAVVNIDDPEAAALAAALPAERLIGFGFSASAHLRGAGIEEEPLAVAFTASEGDESVRLRLGLPGRHNAANALAALAAARAIGIALPEAAAALEGFAGLRRRFDVVGSAGGVTVIDDFAHNPDKIAATLKTLRAFEGRLLLFFQPHGYGPLKKMGAELVAAFAGNMGGEDILVLTDPVYYGGTVAREVGGADIAEAVNRAGAQALFAASREEAGDMLVSRARPGDRIVVMGARDDTLTTFAEQLSERLRTGASLRA